MHFVMICRECRGEGRRSQPPYDVKYPDRALRWRAAEDCDGCDGTGARPAAQTELAEHERAALMDYRLTGVRFPS